MCRKGNPLCFWNSKTHSLNELQTWLSYTDADADVAEAIFSEEDFKTIKQSLLQNDPHDLDALYETYIHSKNPKVLRFL